MAIDHLILSSHRGDGAFGQAIVITTDNVDALFRTFAAAALNAPGIRTQPWVWK